VTLTELNKLVDGLNRIAPIKGEVEVLFTLPIIDEGVDDCSQIREINCELDADSSTIKQVKLYLNA